MRAQASVSQSDAKLSPLRGYTTEQARALPIVDKTINRIELQLENQNSKNSAYCRLLFGRVLIQKNTQEITLAFLQFSAVLGPSRGTVKLSIFERSGRVVMATFCKLNNGNLKIKAKTNATL